MTEELKNKIKALPTFVSHYENEDGMSAWKFHSAKTDEPGSREIIIHTGDGGALMMLEVWEKEIESWRNSWKKIKFEAPKRKDYKDLTLEKVEKAIKEFFNKKS